MTFDICADKSASYDGPTKRCLGFCTSRRTKYEWAKNMGCCSILHPNGHYHYSAVTIGFVELVSAALCCTVLPLRRCGGTPVLRKNLVHVLKMFRF